MKPTNTIAVKVPGVKVKLDGEWFVIPPLSLASLKKLGDRLKDFNGRADSESVQLVLDAAFLSFKRNYPDVTEEWLSEVIDLGNMSEIMQSCMDVSGLIRIAQEKEEGEKETNQTQ